MMKGRWLLVAEALVQQLDRLQQRAGIRFREIAQLLETTPQTVSRWKSGKVEPQPDRLKQLLALTYLAEELSEFYTPEQARLWLFKPHTLLNGDTPADRIRAGKLDDVRALIAQLKDGAYVWFYPRERTKVPFRPTADLLKLLEKLESRVWDGLAWRHMFGENQPTRQNVLGARWNPSGVPAIYCSLDRATALAEGEYAIAAQPLRPTVKRTTYKLHVRLENILDLSSRSMLLELGINDQALAGVDHAPCQRIGGAVEWLEHDGLLVPSARGPAANLVIFPRKQGSGTDFEVIENEVVQKA
jgi:RES domain-containing protein